MWSPIHISSFKTIFVYFSKEVFRLMSDGSLGWLLHSCCRGIRRVCVVAFGPETKNLVAWYQEREERITRRTKKWLGQARKCEVGVKPKTALRHNLNCEKPRGSWPVAHCGSVSAQRCWTREACTLPPAHPALSTLAQGTDAGHQPQARLEAKKGKEKHAEEFIWLDLNDSDKWWGARAFGALEVKNRYLILGCGGLIWSWQRAPRPLRRRLTMLGGWPGKGKLWCNPALCEWPHYQTGKV